MIIKKILKYLSYFIKILVVIFGVLSLFVFFHEIYHLHIIGDVAGICIGHCYVYGEIAPAAIYWENLVEPINSINMNEELNACWFSLGCMGILFFIYILEELIR